MLILPCLGSHGLLVGNDSSLHFVSYDTFYYAFQKSIETMEMMALVFLQSTDDMLTNECNNCLCITKKNLSHCIINGYGHNVMEVCML